MLCGGSDLAKTGASRLLSGRLVLVAALALLLGLAQADLARRARRPLGGAIVDDDDLALEAQRLDDLQLEQVARLKALVVDARVLLEEERVVLRKLVDLVLEVLDAHPRRLVHLLAGRLGLVDGLGLADHDALLVGRLRERRDRAFELAVLVLLLGQLAAQLLRRVEALEVVVLPGHHLLERLAVLVDAHLEFAQQLLEVELLLGLGHEVSEARDAVGAITVARGAVRAGQQDGRGHREQRALRRRRRGQRVRVRA